MFLSLSCIRFRRAAQQVICHAHVFRELHIPRDVSLFLLRDYMPLTRQENRSVLQHSFRSALSRQPPIQTSRFQSGASLSLARALASVLAVWLANGVHQSCVFACLLHTSVSSALQVRIQWQALCNGHARPRRDLFRHSATVAGLSCLRVLSCTI